MSDAPDLTPERARHLLATKQDRPRFHLCTDDCERDHAPCTRQRWLDVTKGRNSAGT